MKYNSFTLTQNQDRSNAVSNSRRYLIVGLGLVLLFLWRNRALWSLAASPAFISGPDWVRLNLAPLAGIAVSLVAYLSAGRFLLVFFQGVGTLSFGKRVVLSFAMGTGLIGFATMALGFLGVMNWSAVGATYFGFAIAGLAVWFRPAVRGAIQAFRATANDAKGWIPALCFGLIGSAAIYGLLHSLVPITGTEDSVAYHMVISKIFAARESIVYIPWMINSNWPLHTYMLYVPGLLFGIDAASNAVHCFFGFGTILAIFSFGRDWMSAKASLFSAACFAVQPVVAQWIGMAQNDLSWSFYAFMAGLCLTVPPQRTQDPAERRSTLILGGLCGALAASCRYQGLAVSGILAAVSFAIPTWTGRTRKETIAFGLIVLAAGSPWYLRNWIVSGNPVIPFLYDVIGGKNWSDYNQFMFQFESRRYSNLLERILSPYRSLAAYVVHLYHPLIAGYAAQYVIIPLAALAAIKFRKPPRLFLLFIAGYALYLPLVAKIPVTWWRFSLPFIAAGTMLLGWWTEQPAVRPLARLPKSVPALIAFIALVPGFFLRFRTVPTTLLGLRSAERPQETAKDFFLRRTSHYYEIDKMINEQVEKDARILLYREIYGYYIDREIVWGCPGDQGLIQYHRYSPDGEDLRRVLNDLGITHILVWHKGFEHTSSYSDFYTAHADPQILALLRRSGSVVLENEDYKLWKIQRGTP